MGESLKKISASSIIIKEAPLTVLQRIMIVNIIETVKFLFLLEFNARLYIEEQLSAT